MIYSIINDWEELNVPPALYTVKTEKHTYYFRDTGVFDEQGNLINELTDRFTAICQHHYDKILPEKANKDDIEVQGQILKDIFEDAEFGSSNTGTSPQINIISTTQKIEVSKWKDSDDLSNEDEMEIEIPVQTIIISE